MDLALAVTGVVVIVVVLYDLVVTAISVASVRGPLSSRIMELTWRLLHLLRSSVWSGALRVGGPTMLLAVFITWVVGLAVGWTLVFSIDGALQSSGGEKSSDAAVPFIDAAFFVIGGLIGRGSSSLSPDEALWSSVEAAMALSGVTVLTLSLAWFIPVVQAVVHKRSVANHLAALGGIPDEILRQAKDDEGFGQLDLYLIALVPEVSLLAQRHLAFPVVHYFHSSAPESAIGPRLTALDELLMIIEASGDRPGGLSPSATRPLRQALTNYLETLERAFVRATDGDPPPVPETERLRSDEILDIDHDRLCDLADEFAARRCLLRSYLEHDGWSWSIVEHDPEDPEENPSDDDADS